MGRLKSHINRGWYKVDGGLDEYTTPIEMASNKKRSGYNFHLKDGKCYKRPGKRLWGQEFSEKIDGVHEYIDGDGDTFLLVYTDSGLYSVTEDSNTLLETLSDDEVVHMHSHRGKCFINSANMQYKFDGTEVEQVGIASPENAPVAALNGAGALAGDYAYRYTFVIEDGSDNVLYESNPSPISNSVSPSSNAVELTVAVSADSRVNARYIYRTSDDGAKYYYEGKIDNNTGTTFDSDTVIDAALGDEVEYNHGQPQQAEFACGANEREYRLKDNILRTSEADVGNAYMEYEYSLRYHFLPKNGKGTGIKSLYNKNTGREDVYIFGEDFICVLPEGDAGAALLTLTNSIGCVQHDSIVEYKGRLIFLNQLNQVCMLYNGRIIDISSRSIKVSLNNTHTQTSARGALIYNHYYSITMRDDLGKLYNHKMFIVDLDRITEIKEGVALAEWEQWNLDAEYILQRIDGTVLIFDNNSKRIYKLSDEYTQDELSDESLIDIDMKWRTKDFEGTDLTAYKQPRVLAVKGKFSQSFSVTPYYLTDKEGDSSHAQFGYVGVGEPAILGLYVLGSEPTTTFKNVLEAGIPSSVVGNTFSFEFQAKNSDFYYEFVGFKYTFSQFMRYL